MHSVEILCIMGSNLNGNSLPLRLTLPYLVWYSWVQCAVIALRDLIVSKRPSEGEVAKKLFRLHCLKDAKTYFSSQHPPSWSAYATLPLTGCWQKNICFKTNCVNLLELSITFLYTDPADSEVWILVHNKVGSFYLTTQNKREINTRGRKSDRTGLR